MPVNRIHSSKHTVWLLISIASRSLQEISNGSLGMKIDQLLRNMWPFLCLGWVIRVPKRGFFANYPPLYLLTSNSWLPIGRWQVYVLDIHLVLGVYHFWEVSLRSGSTAGSRGVGQLLDTSNKVDYLAYIRACVLFRMNMVNNKEWAQVWIWFGSVWVLLWICFGFNLESPNCLFCLIDECLVLESFWTCFGDR